MYRKILSWALLILGTLLLLLSLVGIVAIWVYRVPFTTQTVGRLEQIDTQLTQAKSALDNGKSELQRTLRIVDAADKSLSAMKQQMSSAKTLTDQLNGLLNDKLIPGLKTTRDQIDQLRTTITDLRNSLKTLNSLPFLNLKLPGDQFLADLLSSVDSLDSEINSAQVLAKQASTFVGDTGYLLGGNLSDTKTRIQNLLNTVDEYDQKIAGWHTEVTGLITSVPRWINEAAIVLTVFLLWLAISQFGLILHGLALRQGDDPLMPLRRLRSGPDYDAYVD